MTNVTDSDTYVSFRDGSHDRLRDRSISIIRAGQDRMAESSVENAFDQESDEKARERDPQLHVLVQAEPTADESADRIRADKGRGDDQQREPRRRHCGPPGYVRSRRTELGKPASN